MSNILDVDSISIRVRAVLSPVNKVSLHHNGEILALIGPNGAGKQLFLIF